MSLEFFKATDGKQLLFGSLSGQERLTLRDVKPLEEIINSNDAVSVRVKALEGSKDHSKALAFQWFTKDRYEFIVGYGAVAVFVVYLEQGLQLNLGREEAQGCEATLEFFIVKIAVAIGVDFSKDLDKVLECGLATLCELHPEGHVDLLALDLESDSEEMRHDAFHLIKNLKL
jgi:hypothetical protein